MRAKKIFTIVLMSIFITVAAVLAYAMPDSFSLQENSIGEKNQEIATESKTELDISDLSSQDLGEDQYVYDECFAYRGKYTRLIKIRDGELNSNSPRITLEQAQNIYEVQEIKEYYDINGTFPTDKILESFNEIAGAPDFEGGINMPAYFYALNDEHTEYIEISHSSGYAAYVSKGSDGETEKFEWIAGGTAEETLPNDDTVSLNDNKNLFEKHYDTATSAQRQKLEEVKDPVGTADTFGGYNTKKILEIVNEIPANMPMLTLEQVETICEDKELLALRGIGYENPFRQNEFQEAFINRLDEIAGAPDWSQGESYSSMRIYFLNEQQTEYIIIVPLEVYYASYDANGNRNPDAPLFEPYYK